MSFLWERPVAEDITEKFDIEGFQKLSFINLTDRDRDQIVSMFKAGFFRSTASYIHKLALKVLKNSMSGLETYNFNKVLTIQAKNVLYDEAIIIVKSAQLLGILNKTEVGFFCKTMFLLQAINAEGEEREIKDKDVLELLCNYSKAVFCKKLDGLKDSYVSFVDKLHKTEILTFSEDYINIIESCGKEQVVIAEEMVFSENLETNEVLQKNVKNFLPILWEKIGLRHKTIISIILKETKNKELISGIIKPIEILTDEKMFLKGIELSVDALKSHFEENYSTNELLFLKEILRSVQLTNQLTAFTLSSFLMAYIRGSNKSIKAISMKMLVDVSDERWAFYFKNYFEADENLMLSILSSKNGAKNWCEFVNIFGKENMLNKKLHTPTIMKDYKAIQEVFTNMYLNN